MPREFKEKDDLGIQRLSYWMKSDKGGEILYDIAYMQNLKINEGFPDGSDRKESACNVGD